LGESARAGRCGSEAERVEECWAGKSEGPGGAESCHWIVWEFVVGELEERGEFRGATEVVKEGVVCGAGGVSVEMVVEVEVE
jgi:hypothetical protein